MESSDGTMAVDVSEATILLVDDNEQNLELMQAYLEDLGCEVRMAEPGQLPRFELKGRRFFRE